MAKAKRQGAAAFPFVEPATAQFLDQALRKKVDFVRLLRNPRATAEEAGLTLSPAVLKNLKALGRGVAPGKADAADEEILGFFNKVVTDGRFIHEFLTSPSQVARKLDSTLSRAALKRIKDYDLPTLVGRTPPGATVMSPAAVAVVVAAIIVLWSHDPRRVVIDQSGQVKL
jgi:hypothetical protein